MSASRWRGPLRAGSGTVWTYTHWPTTGLPSASMTMPLSASPFFIVSTPRSACWCSTVICIGAYCLGKIQSTASPATGTVMRNRPVLSVWVSWEARNPVTSQSHHRMGTSASGPPSGAATTPVSVLVPVDFPSSAASFFSGFGGGGGRRRRDWTELPRLRGRCGAVGRKHEVAGGNLAGPVERHTHAEYARPFARDERNMPIRRPGTGPDSGRTCP